MAKIKNQVEMDMAVGFYDSGTSFDIYRLGWYIKKCYEDS